MIGGLWVSVKDLFLTAWVPLLFCAVGTVLGHTLFYLLLGAWQRRNYNRLLEEAAQRDALIRDLKAELWDSYKRGLQNAQMLRDLGPLIEERRNHDKGWGMRVKALLNRHVGT